MSHADDTTQLWKEMAFVETICERWEAFFYPLLDEPSRATALCALGIMVVTGRSTMPPQSVGGTWLSFFGSLAGRPHQAKQLCALGLEMVALGPPRDNGPIRAQIRTILNKSPWAKV